MALPMPASGANKPQAETVRNPLARLAGQPDLPLPEVFRRVCEAAAESLRVERAGIWLFVNGDKVLRCVSLFERSKRKHSKGACLSLVECPSFLRALGTAALLPCESARSDPRTGELTKTYLAPLGIVSSLCAALQRDGRVVGVIFFEHVGSPRNWTDHDRSYSLAVSDLVVNRMKLAEGTLRTAQPTHFVVVPPAVSKPARLAFELKDLLTEIEVMARTGQMAGAAERFARIADAASRGTAIVRGLFEAQAETAEHETVPDALDDDTGEHEALPAAGR
ncbi:MAG TPA: GAF domain-containing protein [Urbifossiella sp.]